MRITSRPCWGWVHREHQSLEITDGRIGPERGHARPQISDGAGTRSLVQGSGVLQHHLSLLPTCPHAAGGAHPCGQNCGMWAGPKGSQQSCSDPLNPTVSVGKGSGGEISIGVLLTACRETEAGDLSGHLPGQEGGPQGPVEASSFPVPEEQVLGMASGSGRREWPQAP